MKIKLGLSIFLLYIISFSFIFNYSNIENKVAFAYTIPYKDKLDLFLLKVKQNELTMISSKYEIFLDKIINKLSIMGDKYSGNTTITEMISYLNTGVKGIKEEFKKNKDLDNFFCELTDSCTTSLMQSSIKLSKNTISTPILTETINNTGTLNQLSTQPYCGADQVFNPGSDLERGYPVSGVKFPPGYGTSFNIPGGSLGIAIKITVPEPSVEGAYGRMAFEIQNGYGVNPSAFKDIVLSACPHDFSFNINACARLGAGSLTTLPMVFNGTNKGCVVEVGKTYYINLRNYDKINPTSAFFTSIGY